jgi:hypothetical protein
MEQLDCQSLASVTTRCNCGKSIAATLITPADARSR